MAAVLLAISVQMWSAPPLWAAEASVQTETSAAGEAKETKDAKAADSETGGEADAEEEETVVVPVIGYSTRSAAGSDYGVMPLADTAVDGALTGVTSINGSELVVDKVNNNFFIGTTEYGAFDKNSKNRAVIGLGIYVGSNDNISVFGTSAEGNGESASAFGYDARADDFASVFGSGANAASNGSAFGYNAEATEQSGSAFGSGAVAGHNYTTAVGYSAKAAETYSIAVGSEAIVEVDRGIAIGAFAHIEKYEGYAESGNIAIGTEAHTKALYSMAIGDHADSTFKNSIAIGASSNTTAENQVSFGTGSVNTVNGNEVIIWEKRRSLAGISDIDMEGALTGVNKIDMKNGALTGVSTINGNVLVPMNEDVTNKSLAIGTGADFKSSYSSVTTIYKNAIAIGNGAFAGGNGSLAIGFDSQGRAASAGGVGSISLNAIASGDHNVVISGWADAYDSVVIGYGSSTDNSNAVAIGSGSYGGGDGTVLGYAAATDGHNSVAIGAKSYVESGNDNQVSFGHKVGGFNYADGSNFTDDLFRSLVNVADIEMHGALTGVTSINGLNFLTFPDDGSMGLGVEPYHGDHATAFGYGTAFSDFSVVVGSDAKAEDTSGVAVGYMANTRGDAVAVGFQAEVMGSGSVALGSAASVNNDAEDGIAFGFAATVEHKNSVAVGAYSSTTAENQVAFGTGEVKTIDGAEIVTWSNRRSLAGISDIDMAGNISLGGEWKENTTAGIYESNGKGELNGVTSINGVIFANDSMNNQEGLLIGTLAPDTYYSGSWSVMIGTNIDNQAIDAVGIGNNIKLTGDGSVAIGNGAQSLEDGIAIGFSSHAIGYDVVAIGTYSYSEYADSVALGSKSVALEDNQVSFGHKADDKDSRGDTYGYDLFRSLTNVADIEMHGALTGVTGIDGVTVSGTDASTGLTVGGNAVIGKINTPFSSTGFAVDKEGAVTAKTVNGATITGTAFNGVTLSTDGKVNGAAITSNSFNGVTLEKGADSHYKVGGVDVTKMQTDVAGKADAATTLTGYGITDAYTKTETDTAVGKKADKATTLTGYGIADAYTKTETDTAIGKKADKATTLTGYGIADAYTKTETDTAVGKKADKATTLTGYGITDAYTKTAADEKITAATADMATKTQVTADIGTAKTALESAYQAADTALGSRSAALETKTAKFNTAGDNLTGMANITSTAATLGGVGFASAGVMTGVASIDGIAIDASRNLSKAGTYNGVTVAEAGISGTSVFNGAAITNNSFNGVTLEKGADNHYKVGGVDVSALKTTVDSISADGVGTADTAGIKRDTTGTATTTIETNTAISSSGITTNKATVSGATATTLENGKLTVGAATVQNTGFAVGSSSLNNGSLTVDGNNKLTTAGLTASKVTVGAVTVSGGKVSGLTDAALSAVSTEAVTGKQLNATNTTVAGKADKATTLTGYGITDAYTKTETTAAIDTAKTELTTAIGKKADAATTLTGYGITDAYTKTAADEKITAATADMATKTQVTADIGTAKTALESAYKAADTALSGRAAALETAATGMSYDAGKNTTTFTGGVTATVLTAGEFKVGATGFGFGSDGALTAKTVNGIEIKKDESKVMVGGIDLTALSNGDVVTDNTKGIGRNQDTATTTIETNTAISSSGITTNAVTASGTVKAGEFVEGDKKLSDKYAAKTALADYTTTTDMNTKFADYATTTAVDTKLADYAKSDSVYSKAAADTAFAKAGDVDTLKTTVGDTDGGLVKDVKDLQSGKADNATTLAGYGIADAYTQTEINEKIVEATKDLATSATVTDIQSGLDEVTGKTAGLSYDTASGSSKFSGSVVIGNEGAKTHTQITDDAIIFGEGTDKQVTVDASGIHVGKKAAGGIALYADADGTHIDHTSLVTGSVTADNLNGVAISGNATDGLSVGGVSIKALSERLDSLEQDGVATADMGGIKRTDVVENSGKTIIEDTTSFTKDGLKTANLEAATAALGGVNFAAGAVTGVSSINGVVFGSDGKIGGVSLSGGKVDGVDVGWLDQRVKSLENSGAGGGGTGGGGSSANTSGIHKPDRDTTNIEGNTSITTDGIDTNKVNASDSIVVADGEKNKTVISKDGILVAEGEKNQVKINEDGIHVGKNSSVVNDTDGFITDKGLYIGVSSSSDTSTAKFSVAPNGNLSSKAGDYGFSNTSADGAKFTHSGDTAYGTGSQLDTTIQGNKVTTGRIDTDELYVDGNKVTVAGGTIDKTDAVNNHLSGADADGNTVTNDFKTSAVNGTTQAAEKTSADGKESTKTVNNTSAGGTGVTTSKTTTDSKDNVTVKESSFGTNEKGMTLSTSNKVTDKDGKVTKDTSGTTTMTGDSISVSKTTTTTEKDADGNEKEVTKTSGTTIGSGEVTLKREDGSTIEVGSAIEGMQSDMRELDGRVNRMGVEIKEVGALSAALAGLHPQPENANSRADFAMAMGSYEGKQALAVGGFYRPDKRTMLSIGASTTSSKHMMNMGISIALDRLPEAERKAKEAAKAAGVEQETLNRVLERLAALEQDNRRLQADNEKRDVAYEKLAADYTQLKEKYIEETADRQQPEQAEAEE